MSGREIRIGQLLAPFGPGSLYIDSYGTPLIVAGIDRWQQRYDEVAGWGSCEDPKEFLIVEPRLTKLLGIERFYSPPGYKHIRKGDTEPPKNSGLTVPVFRFPTWYVNKKHEMKKFNLESRVLEPTGDMWKPVRFVAVCEQGHITDFPWKQWVGCLCESDCGLVLTDRGGADLSSITVRCKYCSKTKSLSGSTYNPKEEDTLSAMERAGITCHSHRPWLGEINDDECKDCKARLVGALINQTNLYFSKLIRSIFIPPFESNSNIALIQNVLLQDDELYVEVTTAYKFLGERVLPQLKDKIKSFCPELDCTDTQLESAINNILGGMKVGVNTPNTPVYESELMEYRRVEFDALSNEVNEEDIAELKVIQSDIPPCLSKFVTKINLVERLRETQVFLGFDRLTTDSGPREPKEMAERAVSQLFKYEINDRDKWLPSVKTYGEGLYIEFDNTEIDEWMALNDDWLKKRIDGQFVGRLVDSWLTLPPLVGDTQKWAYKYLLIHTISHLLLKEVVYECGYSSAALRERLYVSIDQEAPMAGILIYTASGDSEGSLGGLVRLGHPDVFLSIFEKALRRASWCSADPVCSEDHGARGARLMNLSACHACCLLPETACEAMNHGLDRSLVVGTPDKRSAGFMSELIN
ncbi:MAG: hypothetical protein ACI88H_001249 [Cocleimonas sp.]|jgi:hypothetical protein